jgi:hypothetical protein
MKCLVLDYHSTATRDVAMVLRDMGCDVTTWNLSNHMWIFGEEKTNVPFLNDINLSDFNFEIGENFWNLYENQLKDYDFFVTGHTACLSLLFSKTSKPVIVCLTTRYEHPFTGDSESWKRFNDYLISNYSKNKFLFVANNFYDANYFFHYTGIKPETIQSLCHYHEKFWKKSKNNLVLYSKMKVAIDGVDDLKSKGRYGWDEWYSHSGVYCIPYQVSTMSLFEFSAAGMPVIYPSIEETLNLRRMFPNKVLSEISWRSVSYEYFNNSYKEMEIFGNLPSPNDLKDESLKEWLKYSDCYTPWMHNVIGNDSNLNFETKKKIFHSRWKEILERIKNYKQ